MSQQGQVSHDKQILFSACCCCWNAIDLEPLLGCMHQGDCLCVSGRFCCAGDIDPLPVACITDDPDVCCRLSLFCCDYACQMPKSCCLGYGQCLCCVAAQAFPCVEPNPVCQCATFFIKCAPGCGIAAQPTYGDYDLKAKFKASGGAYTQQTPGGQEMTRDQVSTDVAGDGAPVTTTQA
mmetsp:Transcript_9516/g.15587  ORF Transcript_9516/g.15587 Transcript_9516/m.15587 type:complete len:179 (+) Transcript_9516:663-1199(+)